MELKNDDIGRLFFFFCCDVTHGDLNSTRFGASTSSTGDPVTDDFSRFSIDLPITEYDTVFEPRGRGGVSGGSPLKMFGFVTCLVLACLHIEPREGARAPATTAPPSGGLLRESWRSVRAGKTKIS